MKTLIEDKATYLFIGDSITDYGRRREDGADLGVGYVMMAASWYNSLYPEKKVSFINRGIGGNTVQDLKNRWQQDCMELKPSWVSILVGINECCNRYNDKNIVTSPEVFENTYRELLVRLKEELNAKIILMEPFVLPYPEKRIQLREDLEPKIQIVRKLAREFEAIFIPLDGIFAEACAKREPGFWALDGIHPTPAGNALIARAWLEAVEAI